MGIRLRGKYSLTIMILVLFIVLVLSATFLFSFKQSFNDVAETSSQIMADELLEQMENRGTVVAGLLAENLINPIYLNDMAKIHRLLQSVIAQEDISFVYIYDADGKLLHDGTETVELFGKVVKPEIILKANALKDGPVTNINAGMLEVAQSIRLDDMLLGGVVLGLDLDALHGNIEAMALDLNAVKTRGTQNTMGFLFFLTIALMGIATVLSIALAGRLIRPIKEVTDYAQRVGQGDYDFELLPPYKDEIGDLVHAFNRMKSDLKKTTISINELEQEVENRTREIKKTNDKLRLENAIRDKVEKELIKHKEDLEELVSRRTADLAFSNEKLKKEIEERILAEQQREKMQSELKQAQKMEAIGTLAGGVAHDLNNILSAIISYPEMLLMEMSEEDPYKEALEIILDSGKKAATIVQDLLTLARRGVEVKEIVNLKEVIKQYLNSPEFNTLMSLYPRVMVKTDFPEGWVGILGSPLHLYKAVMNMVVNAAEAMPNGGVISIIMDKKTVEIPMKGHPVAETGEYVHILISDNGEGIAEEDMDKIFDPFFSKKKMGRSGTGLGMSVVWGTVKDHNGYIDVKSTPGKGTTFNIYFPAIVGETLKKETKASIPTYNGNESILVIDDLASQRKIAHSILGKRGYEVVSVSSGEEAVEYLKNHSADLLLLDMIMKGGMDGLDTYRKIKTFRPEQKAVIVSGYTENDRIKAAMKLGAGAFLKKPYLMEELLRCVRQALDREITSD